MVVPKNGIVGVKGNRGTIALRCIDDRMVNNNFTFAKFYFFCFTIAV